MPGEWDPLIDKAIDEAARELTEGRPRAALRTNVAARIARHQSSPWGLGWVAASAVAAVVIGAVLMWPTGPNESRISDAEKPTAVIPTALPPTGEVIPGTDTPVRRALSGSPGEPDRVRPTTEILQDELLGSTEPIVAEPLELNALALDAIEIPRLTVEALTVEPLTPQQTRSLK